MTRPVLEAALAGGPLPDLVCRYSSDHQFRTRFYLDTTTGRIEHELIVEPVKSSARIVGAGRD